MALDLLAPARTRIARVEAAAADALAPAEEQLHDGWRLRFDAHGSRRRNSALAWAPGRAPLEARLRAMEAFYADRGAPARVQFTPVSVPHDLDGRLEARGYRVDPGAQVLWAAPEAPQAARPRSTAHVAQGADPGDAYLAVLAAVTPHAAAGAERRARLAFDADLLPRHVWLLDGNDPVACGLAMLDPARRVVGVFDVATLPRARRQGHAGVVLAELAAWAAAQGAEGIYLQVGEDNAAGQRLYARAGFALHHRYHYRVRDGRGGYQAS